MTDGRADREGAAYTLFVLHTIELFGIFIYLHHLLYACMRGFMC